MAKEILHMKIDAELKQELKRLAEAEHRNLSNLIEKVLIEYVEQHKGR
jgi:predicted transcriptional regulator